MKNNRFSEINSSLTSVDFKMISLMRLLLSFSALVIVAIDPTEPDRFVEITYLTLLLYLLYSAGLFIFTVRNPDKIPSFTFHWIDVICYAVLISLSSGTNSVFFFFFLFSILTSSFSWGFRYGMSITIISTTLFTVIGYISAPLGTQFEMNRFLLRPIYLLLLGYMMSYWGAREIRSKKRLGLLKDISRIANPRLGSGQTIELILDNLLEYYRAEHCLLITDDGRDDGSIVYEKSFDSALVIEKNRLVSSLLSIPEDCFISFETSFRYPWRLPRCEVYRPGQENIETVPTRKFQSLADLLNADNFLTSPLFRHGELKGRLYLAASERLTDTDLTFLNQIAEYVFPTLENMRLLEKLASAATEQQRFRISRDIHDGTIQPYIGLKLGLEALELKLDQGKSIRHDLKKLLQMTDAGISNLRRYVQHLENPAEKMSESVLFSAIRQNLAKYQELYGIKIELKAPSDITLHDRLAAEIFQIITEGLSNIRRHTRSNKVTIEFRLDHDVFVLTIENTVKCAVPEFTPKSIAGRVKNLGGQTAVVRNDKFTRISVEIPLL